MTVAPQPRLATSATAEASAQRRTTLVSIGAATLLVALKLGTGLATGSLGPDFRRDRVER